MGFEIDTSGLRKLQENLNQLDEGIEVPILELFSNDFMEAYTTFPDFISFVEASDLHEGEEITEESFKAIPAEDWDQWVQETTAFDSWEDMLSKAGVEHVQRELFKGL